MAKTGENKAWLWNKNNYPGCICRQYSSKTCGDTASVSAAPHKFQCWQSPPEKAGQAQDRRQHKRRQVQIILGTQQRQRGPRIDSCAISWPNKGPRKLSLAFIRKLWSWWQYIMRRYVLTHWLLITAANRNNVSLFLSLSSLFTSYYCRLRSLSVAVPHPPILSPLNEMENDKSLAWD